MELEPPFVTAVLGLQNWYCLYKMVTEFFFLPRSLSLWRVFRDVWLWLNCWLSRISQLLLFTEEWPKRRDCQDTNSSKISKRESWWPQTYSVVAWTLRGSTSCSTTICPRTLTPISTELLELEGEFLSWILFYHYWIFFIIIKT